MRTNGLFANSYRASGIALDVATLPSAYGIGDVGPGAVAWVDRLRDSGQSWWHIATLGGPQDDDPVYESFSSFAANVLLISPDWLVEDGLLSPRDCECGKSSEDVIDYDLVVPFKHWLLEKAWDKFNGGARKDLRPAYEQFRKKQGHWLEDYALFRALKSKYRGAPYVEWPVDLVRRNQTALAEARRELSSQIDQVRFGQFVFSRQIQRLRDCAGKNGVRLIADLPFFAAADSSEVWANPEMFVRDEQETPDAAKLVPYCFSSSERVAPDNDRVALSRVSYRWCVDRLRALLAHVDVARVDGRALAAPRHANGVAANQGSEDCREGRRSVGALIAGPALDRAEASGFRDRCRLPETRVLQFDFDDPRLQHKNTPDSAVYTSPPDGKGARDWFNGLTDDHRQGLWTFLKRPAGEISEVAGELIWLAWSSEAALAIVPLQDLLNLQGGPEKKYDGSNGHRRWRCTREMLSAPAFYWLHELTRTSNRTCEIEKASPRAGDRPIARKARAQAMVQPAI